MMTIEAEKLIGCAYRNKQLGVVSMTGGSHSQLRTMHSIPDGRDEAGFLTSEGRFVPRDEANKIAVSAGQARQIMQRTFLSSDVNW